MSIHYRKERTGTYLSDILILDKSILLIDQSQKNKILVFLTN